MTTDRARLTALHREGLSAVCTGCGESWPCPVVRLLIEIDGLHEVIDELARERDAR